MARLLYGKRRNLPHTYSAAKPGVIDTLLATSSSFTPPLVESVSSQDLRTSQFSFVRGLQRAFTLGELGRGEVLSLLQKNRKMKRLDYSRAVWEWCTTPVAEKEESAIASQPHGKEDTKHKNSSFSRQFLLQSSTLPPQASLWTSAHDVVFMSHINDVGSSYVPLTAHGGEKGNATASRSSSLSLVQQVYQRAIQCGRGNHRALLGGLLMAYSRQDDWHGALRTYHSHIFRDGKLSDSFHLHIVMNVCRRCGAWEEGIQLFQQAVTGKREAGDVIMKGGRLPHALPKGAMKKEGKPRAEGEPSPPSSSFFPAGVPVVPSPNAVVYLELLRLISQSGWPQRYAAARAVVDALHHHSHVGGSPPLGSPLPPTSSFPHDNETCADSTACVGDLGLPHSASPPPLPPHTATSPEKGGVSSVLYAHTSTPPHTSTGASLLPPSTALGNRHGDEKRLPIRLTAGHYNAVLAALKPYHFHHREPPRSRLFRLYDQLLPQFFTPSFSSSSSWQEEEAKDGKKRSERQHRGRADGRENGDGYEEASAHDMPPLLERGKQRSPHVVEEGDKRTLHTTATVTARTNNEGTIPFFLSPPYAPPHVREGWMWWATMQARQVAASPETFPTLLSLHPRHLLHVLSCIEECHRLALPVTVEMYRAALLCFLSPSYLDYIDQRMRKEMEAGWPPEKTGQRLQDAIWFAKAEYQRLEAFEAIPKSGEAAAQANSGEIHEEDEEEEDELCGNTEGTEGKGRKHSSSSTTPDMLGLHLSTALVDVLLAHPRPSEAQYWLTLFASRLRPVLSALTFGVSDRLGVESTADFFSSSSSSSPSRLLLPEGGGDGANETHDSADGGIPWMAAHHTSPSSSSFFWQVHGRVAVVDHNVLLSPLFESLSFHYDAVFIPFSSLRVLVRRVKTFRANSTPAKYTRRALRLLRERIVSFALQKRKGNDGGSSSSSTPLPLYVIPLAHQLYAHRYLEGLSPSSSLMDSLEGEEQQKTKKAIGSTVRDTGRTVDGTAALSRVSSSAPPSLSEKLLLALQDTSSSPVPNATSVSDDDDDVLLEGQTSLSPSNHSMSPLPSTSGAHQKKRSNRKAEEERKKNNFVAHTQRDPTDVVSRREVPATPSVPLAFPLHRPHITLTMPERVLAVACMLKTLNPEASVHVLSSSSFLSTAASGTKDTMGTTDGTRVGDTLRPQKKGKKKEKKEKLIASSALEEAVHRWNTFQQRKAQVASKPFGSKTRDENSDEDEETNADDVVLHTPGALFLTHVYHPTELAEKAPSELQLPSSMW